MSRQIKSDIFPSHLNDLKAQGAPVPAPVAAPAEMEPLHNTWGTENDQSPYYADLLARSEETRYQIDAWTKSVNLKLEKVAQRFQTLEDRLKQSALENHERLANVAGRIKERTSSDLKVEGLIERHNQIVQSFELRLSQAQRVVENQALQLAKQQELIDDARRQIEKLKKL